MQTSPLVEACYGRARELCQELGAREELFAVLFGLRSIMLARGNLRAAHDFGGELLLLAEGAADAGRLLEAHLALGNTFFQLGDPSRARAHLEQGIALYDPVRHRGHSLSFGMDPGMFCLSLLALSLQLLGYLDQALARSAQALALAETLDHPYSRATAANFAGWLHQLRGEPELTRTYTATVLALCAEHEFPSACALATIRHGWARAVTGEGEAGSRQIQQGLQAWEALGARFARAHFLALLAEACATNGRVSEGLTHVNEALAEVERSDERWLAAELRRVQGDLLVSEAGLTTEAEAAWLAAIAIVREQAARFLELRAAVRLGGMWRRQGKARQAAALLDGIHAWFTEGAGTAEMRLASQLLYDVTAKSG